MKPEYIRVQLRAIHTANQKMRRYKTGNQSTMFASYVNRMCPAWHISEKQTDSDNKNEPSLYQRYVLAQQINSISKNNCKPGKYDDDYAKYVVSGTVFVLLPDEWKIVAEVQ